MNRMTDDMRDAAYSDFLRASVTGDLANADDRTVALFALGVSDNPVVQESVIRTAYRTRFNYMVDSGKAEDDMMRRRFATDSRTAMYRACGVSDEDAGRLEFDEMNGDPTGLMKLRETYYFG